MRLALVLASIASAARGAEPPSGNAYLDFVRGQAAALRANDAPPKTLAEWDARRTELRKQLTEAWGGFPAEPCPLDPRSYGELKHDGYRVEKVTIQTRPGVRMTTNLYVPDGPGKRPAVLCVHGHWKGAKQDPVVQSRCIGLAKLGFVVLAVDAFGAGERGIGKALGEYHGEMTAATLLPVGLPLSGLQVYENRRAVDYLLTRPEVDGDRIGVTGASGGGNQTMYAAAMDDRLKAAVPVCSVGTYQAYLGAACCLCEVVPGALKFTEEGAVLALVAPRALMVVSATKDARQFSADEARKSLAFAAPVFALHGKPMNLRHAIFEGGHDYSRPMREAMYGWMTKHLKGEGDGGPIPEPEVKPEDPEALRCYPGTTRPDDFVTVPKYAAAEGRKLLATKVWPASAEKSRASLRDVLHSELAPDDPFRTRYENCDGLQVVPDPGLVVQAMMRVGVRPAVVVVISVDGLAKPESSPLARAAREAGLWVLSVTLRATAEYGWKTDRIGRAPDHTTAEWGLWLGRPLLGQWVRDVRAMLDVNLPKEYRSPVFIAGDGPAGLVALSTAALDDRIAGAAAVNTLASFVSDEPYTNQRLGIVPPGVLRHVGDVAHLAALAAPKRLVIAGGVSGGGKPLSVEQLREAYRPAKNVTILPTADAAAVIAEFAADDIFDSKLKVESAAGTGGEGPTWCPELGVLSSGNNDINRLARDGTKSVHHPKAGTNGLLFDRDGSLIACDSEGRRVVRFGRGGERKVLADGYAGKRFNTPNDLTVDSKGRVYFSDPRYGSKDGMEQRDAAGRTVEGVYRVDPDGTVSRVVGREVERANGVLVSADDKFLFVADNNNDAVGGARKLWRFALKANGSVDVASRKLLYDWGNDRGPDGLKQDAKGRLYVAAGVNKPNKAEPGPGKGGGIYVIDPADGTLLAFLPVPTDEVTNCAFGGDDLRTLYVTAGGTLYSVWTTTPGRVVWSGKK